MGDAIIRTTADNRTGTLSDNIMTLTLTEGGATYQLTVDRQAGDAVLVVDRPGEANDRRVAVDYDEANELLENAIGRGEWNARWRLQDESQPGPEGEGREVHTTITANQLLYLNRGDGNGDGYITHVTTYDRNTTTTADDITVVRLDSLVSGSRLSDISLTIDRGYNNGRGRASIRDRDAAEWNVDLGAALELVRLEGTNISRQDLMDLPDQNTPGRTARPRELE